MRIIIKPQRYGQLNADVLPDGVTVHVTGNSWVKVTTAELRTLADLADKLKENTK